MEGEEEERRSSWEEPAIFSSWDSIVKIAMSVGFNFRTDISDGQKFVAGEATKSEVFKFLATHQGHEVWAIEEVIRVKEERTRVWEWIICIEKHTGNERYVFNTPRTPEIEEAMEEAKARGKPW